MTCCLVVVGHSRLLHRRVENKRKGWSEIGKAAVRQAKRSAGEGAS